MSVDILGTSCDQYQSTVQLIFTSTETRRLVRTDSPDILLSSHTAPELCVVFCAVCGLCSQRQLCIQWPLVPVINKSVIMHTGIQCLHKFVCAEYVYLFVDHFRLIIIILY